MPKMKTKKAVAKRFKKTGTGKISRSHAFTSHLLESKSPKRKRKLRKGTLLFKGDVKRIRSLITYK
jgi:large subunit ribosomal protein L35